MSVDGMIDSYLPEFSDIYSFDFIQRTNSKYNRGSIAGFWEDYECVRERYRKLEKQYINYARRYNDLCVKIHVAWGYEIPCLLNIERILYDGNRNKTIHEIHGLIDKAEQLMYKADFDKFRKELETGYRERWLKEILNEAKEKNCSIVVIREKNFSPSFSSILIFVRDVEAKKSSNISDMWLAFNLKEKTPRASELIGLMKNNSFVEFIS